MPLNTLPWADMWDIFAFVNRYGGFLFASTYTIDCVWNQALHFGREEGNGSW